MIPADPSAGPPRRRPPAPTGAKPKRPTRGPAPKETPTAAEVLALLEPLGKESYKRVLVRNHGVREPCFGVAISELQKLRKRWQGNHALALALYDTGHYDAMYLAGLIADETRMTPEDLQRWAGQAYGGGLPGATVPSVAAEGPHGREMARQWIESPTPLVAAIGWSTWSCLVSVKPDTDLDLPELRRLLARVEKTIHRTPDAVRYQMNSFVIALGCYVAPLTNAALEAAARIGTVTADLGNNDCMVPSAPDYIRKVRDRGTLGRKRKSARC